MPVQIGRYRSVALAAAAAAAAACASIEQSLRVDEVAILQVVNASPDHLQLDVLVAGERAIVALPYLATGLTPVREGTWDVVAQPTGLAQQTGPVSMSFVKHTQYTAIVASQADTVDLLVAADTGVVPAPGTVKLRVIHGAPSAPPLDVYVTADTTDLANAQPTIFPFTYGTGSSDMFPGYLQRDPGVYRVRFTDVGTTTVLLDTGSLLLFAGQVRTVVLADGLNGDLTFTLIQELN